MTAQIDRHSLDYLGWTIVIRLTVVREGECVAGHADLHQDGQHRCRLVSAGTLVNLEEVVDHLETKARSFIDERTAGLSAAP